MSSMRYTSLGVMRPPKPPCWRDFVASSPKSISINSDGVDISDSTARALGTRSPVADVIETSKVPASLPGNKPSRLVRRPRARIHRTRSEHIIHSEDLPDNVQSATLADTSPKGLHVRVLEGPRYVEENNRRCQNWLAGIEAAEPLDEVDYTVKHQQSLPGIDEAPVYSKSVNSKTTGCLESRSSQIVPQDPFPIDQTQQEVDVEIPEETFVWHVLRRSRQKSTSSDEDMNSTCKDTTSQEVCEKPVEIHANSPTTPSTHNQASPTRSPVSATCSPNSLTCNQRITTRSTGSSKRSHLSATCSPLCSVSSKGEVISQIKQGAKSESISGIFVGNERLSKMTDQDKPNKFCDFENVESSSGIDTKCSKDVSSEVCTRIQLSCTDIQPQDASPKGSGFSFNTVHTKSSSSEQPATPKLLSDSELWALNLSTCD